MHFDARTVLVITSLMALVLAAYLFATVHAYPAHIRGLRRWAFGNCAFCCSWAVFAMRDRMPEGAAIFFANGLLLWAVLSFNNSVQVFWGRRFSQRWYLLSPAVALFLVVLSIWWPSYYALRTAFTAVLVSALFLWGAAFLSQIPVEQRSPGSHATQLSFLLGAAISVCRLIDAMALRRDRPANLIEQSSLQSLIAVATCVGIVVLTISFMTMCNERLSGEFRRLSILDPLTEINNRRALEEIAAMEIDRARRDARPVSLLALDLDHFKVINDGHGHEAGDVALRGFVDVLRRTLRSHDLLGRIGGEEFVALLPGTALAEAERIAERARQAIEASETQARGTTLRFTTCIGVAELGPAPEGYKEWLARADRALYEGKRTGRNRVVVAPPV